MYRLYTDRQQFELSLGCYYIAVVLGSFYWCYNVLYTVYDYIRWCGQRQNRGGILIGGIGNIHAGIRQVSRGYMHMCSFQHWPYWYTIGRLSNTTSAHSTHLFERRKRRGWRKEDALWCIIDFFPTGAHWHDAIHSSLGLNCEWKMCYTGMLFPFTMPILCELHFRWCKMCVNDRYNR